jgi:hypothetical protein
MRVKKVSVVLVGSVILVMKPWLMTLLRNSGHCGLAEFISKRLMLKFPASTTFLNLKISSKSFFFNSSLNVSSEVFMRGSVDIANDNIATSGRLYFDELTFPEDWLHLWA